MKTATEQATVLIAICISQIAATARAADWPMWRFDAARSAVCLEKLPSELHLTWVRQLPPQDTAWKDEASMMFDRSYHPVVLGKLLFVGSTVNHALTAYDTETSAERWRFYTGGPIRVAPVAYNNKVYVGSDDGHLYCVDARDGKLQWKVRGGPTDRRLIGNQRFISTWPIRGGPVAVDDTVYFTSGVWPFMGTFIYAVDAQRGTVNWVNDSTSFTFRRMPHYGSAAFSGLSPQGHLVVTDDRLIVPGSRLNPAVLDRRAGKFLSYAEAKGPAVAAQGQFGFAGGQVFDVVTGNSVRLDGAGRFGLGTFGDDAWHTAAGVFDPTAIRVRKSTVDVPHGNPGMKMDVFTGSVKRIHTVRMTPWLRAGSKLVGSRGGDLQMLDVSNKAEQPSVVWETKIDGTPSDMLAADGKLFVVTVEGAIHCFSPKRGAPKTYGKTKPAKPSRNSWDAKVRELLKAARVSSGYAMVWGLKDGGLVEALVAQSKLYVIAVDADAARVDSLRHRLDAAGAYGARAVALIGDPTDMEFAPYLAGLIVSEDLKRAGFDEGTSFIARLARPLRPYGGTACLPASTGQRKSFDQWVQQADLAGYEVKHTGTNTLLVRSGPLPGSAPWLGQNADAANTRCSRDQLVMAPLGVLWFGNALSNSLVLPRHGEGPVEQVAGGRMFIEGPDSLSATDVYTGRLLWTRSFPGLGKYYIQTKHQRGAHVLGSNFFAVADAVYVAVGKSCHLVDPATSRTRKELKLPDNSDWMFLLVYDDLLIAGAHPIVRGSGSGDKIRYNTPASSRKLVAMDRNSGKVLWTRAAEKSFGHFAICAGGGKVFCIDRTSPETLDVLARRGQTPKGTPRIYALDARSGDVLWHTSDGVGAQLTYGEEHDILLSGAAMRGTDGAVLWYGPVAKSADGSVTRELLWSGKSGLMLRGTTILPQGNRAFDLLTGKQRKWTDPSGNTREWTYPRSHGCGPKVASEHLLMFRSACAGFVDLRNDSGTGNLGGFRSGCTPNLIVADGVLNAPDYTRTCGCDYQNRSSLGLIHMPDVEFWTHGAAHTPGRIGFNLGAPGDRRADDGTLWRAVPNVPDQMSRDKTIWWGNAGAVNHNYVGRVMVETVPQQPERFYRHSSRVKSTEQWKWIGGSGLVGLRSANVPLYGIDIERPFTLRLCFAEPEHTRPGGRVFSVVLGGKEILKDLDVFRESGGQLRTVVKEYSACTYSGRRAGKRAAIELTFKARAGEPLICGIEVEQAVPEKEAEENNR